MNLEENGDVLWVASPGAEDLPLITCETYDMFHTSVTGLVIRFGSYQGHIIEFRVSPTELSNTSNTALMTRMHYTGLTVSMHYVYNISNIFIFVKPCLFY